MVLLADRVRPGEKQVGAEHGHADRAERHQADLDFVPGQALAQHRTEPDADRKQRQQHRVHARIAAQHLLGVTRQLGEIHRAEEPEPGDAEARQQHRAIAAQQLHIAPGFAERVPVDLQLGVDRRRLRHRQRGAKPEYGQPDRGRRDPEMAIAFNADQARTEQGAEQDRQKRGHLDQAIAADQFLVVEHLRKDAVFERPEQGRMQAHHEQGGQQQADVRVREADRRHDHDRDFEQLHRLRQPRLVVFVGQLPGSGREQEERQDEQAGGQVRVLVLLRLGQTGGQESDQDDQRVLEHVVVEGAKRLGQEERQEAAFLQQCELVRRAHADSGGTPATLASGACRGLRV